MKRSPMKLMEPIFCIVYLAFAFIAGIIFITRKAWLLAIMTLLLAVGDAFHLVPRIRIGFKGKGPDDDYQLGLGNMISSITMTLFYIFLYLVMKDMYPDVKPASFIFPAILVLSAVRIILCFMPQNDWFKRNKEENKWHIYRNIPFVLVGILTIFYLIVSYHKYLMAALVFVSFACYMGTVLYAGTNPKMGMLMIPKTICYIWLIASFL